MVTFLIIIICLMVLVLLAVFICGWQLCDVLLHPKVRVEPELTETEIKNKRFTQEFIDSLDIEKVQIKSDYGYMLHGRVCNTKVSALEENSKRVAVLCHGYTSGKMTMLGYGKILMDLGFTVVVYDHRNHGENDKCFTTMGYYEKYDLKTVIDWCFERFGSDIRVVTMGESMGAATVLNHLAIDDRPACTIADCGYSDLYELCCYITGHVYHLPAKIVIPVAMKLLKLRAGFDAKDVRPQDGSDKSDVPILFIHGDKDDFVPTYMSKKMYKERKGPKELYLCEGASHAVSHPTDPLRYSTVVENFIKKYYS